MPSLRILLVCCLCLFVAGTSSCKKSTGPGQAPVLPVVYPKGTSLAQSVSATIGSAGGTLASGDGILEIIVPAGAVSQPTGFSIEPITNTLPASTGNAYDVNAGGIILSKPATITVYYDQLDLKNSALRFLYLAWQDEDGYWHMINNTTINEATKSISAETTHFSNWAVFEGMQIIATTDPVTKQTTMNLMTMELGDSARFGRYMPVDRGQSAKWSLLSGAGTLQTNSDGNESVYTPVPNIPAPAIVEVDIENLPDYLNQPARNNLADKIRFEILNSGETLEEEFIEYTVTGSGGPRTIRCKASGARIMGTMVQGSTGTPGNLTSSIYINIDGVSGTDDAVYNFGPPSATGANFIRCMTELNGKLFEPAWYETISCVPREFELAYTDGQVIITHWDNASNKYLTGSFTGHLKAQTGDPEACPRQYETISINGSFKVKMR